MKHYEMEISSKSYFHDDNNNAVVTNNAMKTIPIIYTGICKSN